MDSNNIAPRLGFTYDLGGKSVIRAGVGRFYDKTHFEVIGGLYTGTPFTNSFTVNFPTAAADNGPRNGQLPTDPFLVNGPVLNRTLLEPAVSGRPAAAQHRRDAGTTRIASRRYTDEISARLRAPAGNAVAASVDYVHSHGRDLLMSQLDLNPQVRSNPTVATSTLVRVEQPGTGRRDGGAAAEVSRASRRSPPP